MTDGKCNLPGCSAPSVQGSRLCHKHASAGQDLRVPVKLIETGLLKIYDAIWYLHSKNSTFTVADVAQRVVTGWDLLSSQESERWLNDLGKMFRTLRANNYVTKVGFSNGFVCYRVPDESLWDRSAVSLESDDPQPQVAVLASDQTHQEMLEQKQEAAGMTVIDQARMAEIDAAIRSLVGVVAKLSKDVEALQAAMEAKKASGGPDLENVCCPLLRLKQAQSELLRGEIKVPAKGMVNNGR